MGVNRREVKRQPRLPEKIRPDVTRLTGARVQAEILEARRVLPDATRVAACPKRDRRHAGRDESERDFFQQHAPRSGVVPPFHRRTAQAAERENIQNQQDDDKRDARRFRQTTASSKAATAAGRKWIADRFRSWPRPRLRRAAGEPPRAMPPARRRSWGRRGGGRCAGFSGATGE